MSAILAMQGSRIRPLAMVDLDTVMDIESQAYGLSLDEGKSPEECPARRLLLLVS